MNANKPIGVFLICMLLLAGCQLSLGADTDALIATGIAQTQEVGGYLTQIAANNGSPTESLAITPEIPTDQPEAASACAAPSGSPNPDDLNFPAQLGTLEQSGDQWMLNEAAVLVYYQADSDCETEVWLSLVEAPDWPLMIRSSDGDWQTGAEVWNGRLSVVNTSTQHVQLVISADLEGFGEQEVPLTPDELADLSVMPPGGYTLSFSYGDYAADCHIQFSNTSNYLFSIIDLGVAVLEESFEPQNSNEVNILSSPLCAQ